MPNNQQAGPSREPTAASQSSRGSAQYSCTQRSWCFYYLAQARALVGARTDNCGKKVYERFTELMRSNCVDLGNSRIPSINTLTSWWTRFKTSGSFTEPKKKKRKPKCNKAVLKEIWDEHPDLSLRQYRVKLAAQGHRVLLNIVMITSYINHTTSYTETLIDFHSPIIVHFTFHSILLTYECTITHILQSQNISHTSFTFRHTVVHYITSAIHHTTLVPTI